MKKRATRLATLFFAALILASLFATPAAALGDNILPDLLDAIPESVRDPLADYATPEGAEELIGAEYVASLLLSLLSEGLAGTSRFLLSLLGMALLFALAAELTNHFGSASAEAATTGMAVALVAFLFSPVSEDVGRALTALGDMREFSGGLIPLFGGLYAMGGSSATAVASATGFGTFSYLLGEFVTGLLPELLRLLFAFTLISAVREKSAVHGVFRSLRGLYVSALGFAALLLVTSIGFQSTLTASSDSLATTSVRFAVGNLIPIIGGSLGGTLRTVSATLSLLKSTVGTLAVAALLLLLLPPLITLLLHRFSLSLAAGVSEMLGAPRGARVFREFCGIYDLVIATLAIGGILFLLILGIFARCGLALGSMFAL